MTERKPESRHESIKAGDFIRVGTLDELKRKRMKVVSGRRHPILVVYEGGRLHALDNRCPHLGFPLHQGSVENGILTCHWHHARFDLESGCTFDLWADDVPRARVEVRGDAVWVAADCSYPDEGDYWRTRLGDAMAHDLDLVTGKAVLGLLGESVASAGILADAFLFGARNRDDWSAGSTILAALANVLPTLDEDDRYLALFKGISEVAGDCAGEMPRRDRKPLAGAAPSRDTTAGLAPALVPGASPRRRGAHRADRDRRRCDARGARRSPDHRTDRSLLRRSRPQPRFHQQGDGVPRYHRLAARRSYPAHGGQDHGDGARRGGGERLAPPARSGAPPGGGLRRASEALQEGGQDEGRLAGSPRAGRGNPRRGGRAHHRRHQRRHRRRRPADGPVPRARLCGGDPRGALRHLERVFRLERGASRLHLRQRIASGC